MMGILGILGRWFSLLTIPLTALAIWGIIQQVRKEQRLTLSSPIIGLVMAPVTLLINIIFLRQAFRAYLGPALLILGLALGLAWGQATRLYAKGKTLVAKRSIMHLVCWAISYALTQILATIAPASIVAGGLAAMFFSTGSTLGTNLNLIVRQLQMRPALAAPVTAARPSVPERERATAPPGLPESPRRVTPPGLPERGTAKRDSVRATPPDLPR